MFSLQTISVYYARDVLGDPNYIVITAMKIGLMFVLAPFVPRLARAFGKKAIYLGSGAVMIAGCAGVLVAPSGTLTLLSAASCSSALGSVW